MRYILRVLHWNLMYLSLKVILWVPSILHQCIALVHLCTAISRKVAGRNVHETIPKGNMGYDQYTVPDFVAVEPTFVVFL